METVLAIGELSAACHKRALVMDEDSLYLVRERLPLAPTGIPRYVWYLRRLSLLGDFPS